MQLFPGCVLKVCENEWWENSALPDGPWGGGQAHRAAGSHRWGNENLQRCHLWHWKYYHWIVEHNWLDCKWRWSYCPEWKGSQPSSCWLVSAWPPLFQAASLSQPSTPQTSTMCWPRWVTMWPHSNHLAERLLLDWQEIQSRPAYSAIRKSIAMNNSIDTTDTTQKKDRKDRKKIGFGLGI